MSNITYLKKIVAKNLVNTPIKEIVKAFENDGDKKELYRLIGQASGYQCGDSNYGPWTAFKGNFEAYNMDGEVFKSNKAFILEPLQTMLKNALDESEGATIDFALSVSVKRRDDLGIGYEYNVSPILEVKESDSLSHLRAMALPSPEKAEEKPAEKAPAEKPAKAAKSSK